MHPLPSTIHRQIMHQIPREPRTGLSGRWMSGAALGNGERRLRYLTQYYWYETKKTTAQAEREVRWREIEREKAGTVIPCDCAHNHGGSLSTAAKGPRDRKDGWEASRGCSLLRKRKGCVEKPREHSGEYSPNGASNVGAPSGGTGRLTSRENYRHHLIPRNKCKTYLIYDGLKQISQNLK
ncbi:hypothetical protein VTI28DRAFT_8653 [Corynascus sepedonium]